MTKTSGRRRAEKSRASDGMPSRRDALRSLLPAAVGASTFGHAQCVGGTPQTPVRAITRGPKFHWFGYYDKLQFDPTGRYVLGMQVDFEHRSPRADDVIRVGMVDLRDGDRWIELGDTRAWCWQQGCMLQWLPGSATKILWNDREGERFVCRTLDVKTNERGVLPSPVYAVAPDGRGAVTTDFRRLIDVRPGYGYAGLPDPFAAEAAPRDSGVWRVDIDFGRVELILSIADVSRFGRRSNEMQGAKHWFNHLLFNPDGSRFAFLHRWRPSTERRGGFHTRMLTARADGSGLHVLDPSGHTSHFIWRDPGHVLAWTKPEGSPAGFYLLKDRTNDVEPIGKGVMVENGHCTFLPGAEWILNDTYPDRERLQHVYLFHVRSGRRVPLGSFLSRKEYAGEWRCDTHPRFSPDGKRVTIDSPHLGGRQMHLIDASGLVG
jgi:hypothetical protein